MKVLLKEQLKFMNKYFEIVAVSSDGDCFEEMLEEQGGIRGVKIEMTRKITIFKDLKALYLLMCLFIKEKPYIVHTHTPKAGLLGMLAAWITRVPNRYHTVAGLPLLVATGYKRKILNTVERLTNFCATKVFPNSFAMMDIMKLNRLAQSSKMKVLGNGSSNGIDTEYFNPDIFSESDKDNFRLKLGINKNDFVFIFIGRIVKDKGINELVAAYKKLCNDIGNIKLILLGTFENDLNPIKKESEIFLLNSPNVIYAGFQKDIRPFLSVSDVFVFPSYREGFPNVVMQAGAMGLPSIVTNINGCNEIIIHEKNGLIVEPKDIESLYNAMKTISQSKEYSKKLSKDSRHLIVSRYERHIIWDALLQEYLEV